MRMMGAESVEYHRSTVLGRADDHPGMAMEYYASRGETPLVWGGSAAAGLGLAGAVTPESYVAVFGPGGAKGPRTGERLVQTRRPGMEIVISAHKSVAELGVIDRADTMHRVMDAERDATLAYLDEVTRRIGGRRGEASRATPTGGLVYAHTRHATSKAGDPCPHDHVLLANVLEMKDSRAGGKRQTRRCGVSTCTSPRWWAGSRRRASRSSSATPSSRNEKTAKPAHARAPRCRGRGGAFAGVAPALSRRHLQALS